MRRLTCYVICVGGFGGALTPRSVDGWPAARESSTTPDPAPRTPPQPARPGVIQVQWSGSSCRARGQHSLPAGLWLGIPARRLGAGTCSSLLLCQWPPCSNWRGQVSRTLTRPARPGTYSPPRYAGRSVKTRPGSTTLRSWVDIGPTDVEHPVSSATQVLRRGSATARTGLTPTRPPVRPARGNSPASSDYACSFRSFRVVR